MKKYFPILKDAVILLAVSTIFVSLTDKVFKSFKKSVDANPLVTAMLQNNMSDAQEMLSDKGMADFKQKYASLQEYEQARLALEDDFGRTPLMMTAYANIADAERLAKSDGERAPFAELFIKDGAKVDAQDKDGWTPLMWAAWSGLPAVAADLLNAGANTALVDNQGNTALTLAAMRGNAAVVQALLAKKADATAAAKNGKKAADFAREGLAQFADKKEAYEKILAMLPK
jgi:ankyrin repeat protein